MRLFSRLFFLSLLVNFSFSSIFDFSITNDIYKLNNLPIQYDKKQLNNLSSLNSKINSAFIQNRSYGSIGQVNTIALDGGLSSHTRIGWNNLNIEVGQMNSLDVSLLPLEFAEYVEIYRDNLSPSGIMGQAGFVNFISASVRNMLIDFELESYDTYSGKFILRDVNENFDCKAGFSFISSSNSYPYIDSYGISNKTENLDFKRMAFFSDLSFPFAKISFTHTYKNGGTGISYNTEGRQEDLFDTLAISTKVFDSYVNFGFINWENSYVINNISEDNHINRTFSFDIANKFEIFSIENTLKPSLKYFTVNSTKISNIDNYQIDLVYKIEYSLYKFDFDLSIDNIYRKDFDFYLVPGGGFSYNIFDGIKIFASISRGLLFPSFNDLYWPSDIFSQGNTNLKPEDGIRWQGGVVLFYQPFYFNSSYTESYIDNQIIWKPDSLQKWTPQNIGKVLSRIANFLVRYEDHFSDFRISGEISFSYNYSINNDRESIYYGKRILYIPLYKWSIGVLALYKEDIELNLVFRAISERYTVEANTAWLKAYNIFDIYFRFYFFYFSVENVFDVSYEEISGYPQKGRVYKAGLKFEF